MLSSSLLNPELGFCIDDVILFKVEITVFGELELVPENNSIKYMTKSISKCLHELLQRPDTSDFDIYFDSLDNNINTNQSQVLKVHKCILRMRSPVFDAMLSSEMCESTSGSLCIADADYNVMKELIHFIYTDDISDNKILDSIADQLLCVSSKYQILNLLSICEDYLITNINMDNVFYYLNLASMYHTLKLKEQTLIYIAHNFNKLSGTKEFNELDYNLQNEIKVVMDLTKKKTRTKSTNGDTNTSERRFSSACIIL
jgi:hypothetical protein